MKMLTHLVFGAGVVVSFFSLLPAYAGLGALESVVIAVVLSFLANRLIDDLGHRTRNGLSVRSPLTHSVFTAPVWGAGAGYVLWLAGSALKLLDASVGLRVVIAGVVVAYSHLLLDSMTEGGVYFTTKRIALAHFSNRNLLLNTAFLVGGLALFLLELWRSS